jgi:spore coat protein JB
MNRYKNEFCQDRNSNPSMGSNNVHGGCGCHNNQGNGSMGSTQAQLLTKLRKVDFAIYDIMLYLDAYPHCKAALEHYKKLLAESNALREQLANSGMPITASQNCTESWIWINSPWPWEYEANV